MQRDYLKKEYILDYVSSRLDDFIGECIIINDAKFHHNTSYSSTSSIIKNNILSMEELARKKIKNYSDDVLSVMNDTDSHANGSNGISLSIVGLDDINDDEFEYDPFNVNQVDLLIQSDVVARRNSVHYGNEYIASDEIEAEKISSIDVRLFKYIDLLISKGKIKDDEKAIATLVQRYNCLRNMAITLKQVGLDIPIREMSYDNCCSLDVDMLASSPKLILRN